MRHKSAPLVVHRYVINIFNRRHIFPNVFIVPLLIPNRPPRFASFSLLRIIRDPTYIHTYVVVETAYLKVENENAQTRPRIHVQIGVQILVVRLSNS